MIHSVIVCGRRGSVRWLQSEGTLNTLQLVNMLADCYSPRLVSFFSDDKPLQSSEQSPPSTLNLELGLVHNASGSAFLHCGDSKIVCSIHGPYVRSSTGVFSGSGQMECDIKYAQPAMFNEDIRLIQPQDVIDALQNSVLLQKYAKMTISINIVVLEAHCYDLANAICCASLALLDARIEMVDLVCASTVRLMCENEDRAAKEENKLDNRNLRCDFLTVASIPTTGRITQICFDGKSNLSSVSGMIQDCMNRNLALREGFRTKILSSCS